MRNIILITSFAFLGTGCPNDPVAPDATPCDMEVEWGPKRTNGFEAFSDGARAELTLGFQGFRYVSSTVRMATDSDADRGEMLFQISVEDQETYVVTQPFEVVEEEADGWRYNDDALVFFNDLPPADVVGKEVIVTARGSIGNCRGAHTATVTVVDDDNCVEQPDGTLLCE